MILFCATTNPGKLREFQQAAKAAGLEVQEVPDMRRIEPPEETGDTFAENAILKAVYYSHHALGPVFCDDSGLVVDALRGAPGVYSARYAGAEAADRANNDLLMRNMRGQTNRACRFVCVIALARGGELVRTFEGVIEGRLLEEERGSGGFGYDPLFYYPPFGCTLAEASLKQKQDISHRGQALGKMFRFAAGL